jgi:hypothetical protein
LFPVVSVVPLPEKLIMLRSFGICLLSLCGIGLLLGTVKAATVYDLATEYSTTINTNGSTWSYRSGTAHDGNYPLLDLAPGAGPGFGGNWTPGPNSAMNPGWQYSVVGTLNIVPYVSKNITGVTQTFTSGGTFQWPADKMVVHPDAGQLVVVSWLSPGDGIIDIASQIVDAHISGAANSGVTYFIDSNAGVGPDSLASGLVVEGGDSGPINLSGIGVTAGDRINFVIGLENVLNSNGTYLDATITFSPPPAPEPSSLLLAGLGCLVLRRVRRRIGS